VIPLGLRAAARHLTIAPLAWDAREPDASAGSLVWFPAIGLGIGALVWGLLQLPLPPLTRAALALCAWIAVTAGLHEDGVMDCADAAFAPVEPARREAIRKDPRVGAHGVAFFALLFAIRLGGLYEGPAWAALLAPVAGRWTMAVTVAYGRPASVGLGSQFTRNAPRIMPSAIALVLVSGAAFAIDPTAAVSVVSGLIGGVVAAAWFARRLGSFNGDVHGAGGVIAETVTLVIAGAVSL
jgi:adenosylcobinamide-GDP ribazoletransferase